MIVLSNQIKTSGLVPARFDLRRTRLLFYYQPL
jgi:hypothetical protein